MPPIRVLNALAVLCCGVSVVLAELHQPQSPVKWSAVDCDDRTAQGIVLGIVRREKDSDWEPRYNRKGQFVTVRNSNVNGDLMVWNNTVSKKDYVLKTHRSHPDERQCREIRAYNMLGLVETPDSTPDSTPQSLGKVFWRFNNHPVQGTAVEKLGGNLMALYDGVRKDQDVGSFKLLVLNMFLSCAKALQTFHESGLTHFDVTLENFITLSTDHTDITAKADETFESRIIDFEFSRTPKELQKLSEKGCKKGIDCPSNPPVHEEVRKLYGRKLNKPKSFVAPEALAYDDSIFNKVKRKVNGEVRKLRVIGQSADIFSLGMQFQERFPPEHRVDGLNDIIEQCIATEPGYRINDDDLVKALSDLWEKAKLAQ